MGEAEDNHSRPALGAGRAHPGPQVKRGGARASRSFFERIITFLPYAPPAWFGPDLAYLKKS